MKQIKTYKETRKILRTKGVKVAIAIQGRSDVQVFAEKSDFINEMDRQEKESSKIGPANYDGEPEYFNYDADNKILYVDGGI